MADTIPVDDPADRLTLPIGGVFAASLWIFAAASLLFLAYGVACLLATLARLTLSPPGGSKTAPHLLIAFLGKLLFVFQTTITSTAVRIRTREPMSVGEGLALGVRRYLPMPGLTTMGLLAVYAGIILLIVPGVVSPSSGR